VNHLLLKNKPKDITNEKFEEMWNNSGYLLRVLAATIQDMVPQEKIKPEDFSNPNHYAQMVWAQAQRDFAKKLLDLMPNFVDKQ
jgi:hypothetical protein